jgi:uncharacterized membrane protein
VTEERVRDRPIGLAIFLILMGAIGWFAAFQLTVEKFALLENPGSALACDVSKLVQCSVNLGSAQGSLLGFPNPILGLSGWVAPIAVGVALLAGARFARWFWWLFNAGIAAAMAFVVFLITTSIYFLGTLCPWCMLTWAVTIPTFWVVALHAGTVLTGRNERMPRLAVTTAAVLTVLSYLVVAVLAQTRLDVIADLL